MAFAPVESKTIEVICSKDAAVGCTKEEYQLYLKTLDEEYLELKPGVEPTRFVLKTVLDYKAQQAIKNNQISYKDGDVGIKMGYTTEEVRMALVDVKNPGSPSIAFKKDGDGYACKRLMALLDPVVADLHQARQNALAAGDVGDLKKKSQPSLSSPTPTPAS